MHGNNDSKVPTIVLLKKRSKERNILNLSINLREEYDSEQEQPELQQPLIQTVLNLLKRHQEDLEHVQLLD